MNPPEGYTKEDVIEFLAWFNTLPIEEFMANCCTPDMDGLRVKDTQRYMNSKWNEWVKLTGRESDR